MTRVQPCYETSTRVRLWSSITAAPSAIEGKAKDSTPTSFVPPDPLHTTQESESTVQKSVLLRELQKEIRRHDLPMFVDDPASVPQGGKGVTVPGCRCGGKDSAQSRSFLNHQTNDVLPAILDKLPAEANSDAYCMHPDENVRPSVEMRDDRLARRAFRKVFQKPV
jgi:hypothetical protein